MTETKQTHTTKAAQRTRYRKQAAPVSDAAVALPPPTAFPWHVLFDIETAVAEIEGLTKLLICVAGSCHEIEGPALYPVAHSLDEAAAKITTAWEAAWAARRAGGEA